jgi:hypothetical protein
MAKKNRDMVVRQEDQERGIIGIVASVRRCAVGRAVLATLAAYAVQGAAAVVTLVVVVVEVIIVV